VIIAIVVGALIVLALVAMFITRRRKQTELLRERQASEAAGHRQEADAHAAKAQELAPEAEALRREATEHAALAEEEAARAEELDKRATQVEQQKSREGHAAGRHDEAASLLQERAEAAGQIPLYRARNEHSYHCSPSWIAARRPTVQFQLPRSSRHVFARAILPVCWGK